MENNANELKTGIEANGYFWGADAWYDLWLCGRKVGTIVCAGRALSQLEGIARNQGVDLRAARAAYVAALEVEAAHNASQAAQTLAPVNQAAPVANVARNATARPRCCFHKAIRRCFAIAKDAGLDTRADEAMRAAFGAYLCRDVPSRESLSGGDWMLVGNAIKAGRLAW